MAHTFPPIGLRALPLIESHGQFHSVTSPPFVIASAYVCQRDGYISLLSSDILFVLAFPRRLYVAQEQECLISMWTIKS